MSKTLVDIKNFNDFLTNLINLVKSAPLLKKVSLNFNNFGENIVEMNSRSI